MTSLSGALKAYRQNYNNGDAPDTQIHRIGTPDPDVLENTKRGNYSRKRTKNRTKIGNKGPGNRGRQGTSRRKSHFPNDDFRNGSIKSIHENNVSGELVSHDILE